MLAFGYAALAVIALNFLRADYDPMRHAMSDYAVGPYGGLMGSAFIALSLGMFALLGGLVQAGPPSLVGRIGYVFLGIAAVGTFFASVFKVDIPGAPYTQHGTLHIYDAILNFTTLIATSLLLSIAFRLDARWHSYFGLSLALALAIPVTFLVWFLSSNALFGVANKIFFAALVTWLLATGHQLRTVARKAE
jgi:hypothetical protein